jgi:Recombination endonuclease VII
MIGGDLVVPVDPQDICPQCNGSKYRYSKICSSCYHENRRGARLGNYVSKTGLIATGVKRQYRFISRVPRQERRIRTPAYSAMMYLRARCRGYGISPAEYVALLVRQDYCCGICRKKPRKSFHIDHDRETGRVRGLLCGNCNRAIGYLHHDIQALQRAIAYLDDRSE